MKKNHKETKKELKKEKEPVLDSHNEIKIITTNIETFKLKSELISNYLQRKLLNLDASPPEKMQLNSKWVPLKDGILDRGFFKWLSNCENEDWKKLIIHLPYWFKKKRTFAFPKVTLKQLSKVLEDCYSKKEWLEHRNQKALVRRELNKLKPSLGFFNAVGIF